MHDDVFVVAVRGLVGEPWNLSENTFPWERKLGTS